MAGQKPASGPYPPRTYGRIVAFLCLVKVAVIRTERKNARKRESKPGELHGSHTGTPGGHSVIRCGSLSQGSLENEFMLFLMHCRGGWLPENKTG